MATFPAPWALCGGWAVDAWLGRQTRDHGDVDVSVFVQDQEALFRHLSGWQLVAHDRVEDGTVPAPLWDGRPLVIPGHLHCRLDRGEPLPEGAVLTPEQGFVLDVLLDNRSGDEWLLWDEPRVSTPLVNGVQESPWGLPTVVPEVLLFFKATEPRRRDHLDFAALLPHLGTAQRDWLRDAVSRLGHPWLRRLSA
jgi:hypothetical protein